MLGILKLLNRREKLDETDKKSELFGKTIELKFIYSQINNLYSVGIDIISMVIRIGSQLYT